MTSCMLIQPPNIVAVSGGGCRPVILADTIATLEGRDNSQALLPTNVTRGDVRQISKVILVRKLYIFHERFAVAFAGDGKQIEICLDEISGLLPVWLRLDRPMQSLQDLVHEKYPDIQVVGGNLEPQTKRFNSIAPVANTIGRRALGTTAAIGSGRDAMEAFAQEFESVPGVAELPAIARGASFTLKLVGTTLTREIFGDVRDWGGYLEFAYVAGDKWIRGPRTLHLFLALEDAGPGSCRPFLVPRAIAYDPGDLDARMLAIHAGGPDDGFVVRDYIVQNRLEKPAGREIPTTEAVWIGWRPDCVMVSIAHPTNGGLHSVHDSLTGERIKDAIFQIEEKRVQFGLAEDALIELAKFGSEALGLKLTL